ncbi:MAG: ATP-binding protein [Intrasporangium sp.]|uniref:ATP-binding protein n=1 Tax=Intrasporangium sp. TaxID=1925024 RepID=UPI00264A2087|nr:ATP-binding protein [Intrasporangium sp.]MDN5794384.1 ATP-binding protein [Intrasporangium sp.]
MTTSPRLLSADASQRDLVAALGQVRAALERHAHAGRNAAADVVTTDLPHADLPAADGPAVDPADGALSALCQGFSLSTFERAVLVLAAGPDLDGSFPALCADAQDDPHRPYPTFGLALATLPDAHWSALSPAGPLRCWHLVELSGGQSPAHDPIRADEYVLHLLTGAGSPDPRLAGIAEPDDRPPTTATASLTTQARLLAGLWGPRPGTSGSAVLPCLVSRDPGSRLDLARHAAALLGLDVLLVDARALPGHPSDVALLTRLIERTCVLEGRVAVIELDPDDDPGSGAAQRLADQTSVPVALSARDLARGRRRHTVPVEVGHPTRVEQRELWCEALSGPADAIREGVDHVTGAFDLDAGTIASTADLVRAGMSLWEAARRATRPRMEALAQRIEPSATLDDLVLPAAQHARLAEMAVHVRHRGTVYGDWAMGRSGRGLGTTALFAGPSGTGKTMAAEALAADLELDLYRVDLSAVVSKYIGETEKNLRRLFDAADDAAAVLLFDEADALFGRRTEVRDSHDRYANVEVSYLLQRMEQYRGIAVLTTNFREALDPAFSRRLRFVVEFPFPDTAARLEIWRGTFPPQAPVEGLDLSVLAHLNLSGGGIRSVAVNAAFHAADDGGVVRMHHVLRAARAELAKLDLSLPDLEGAS